MWILKCLGTNKVFGGTGVVLNFSTGGLCQQPGSGKICRDICWMPLHHFSVSRKSDGLHPSRGGSLELVSLSLKFFGRCWAMMSLLGITSPSVLLKMFL